MDNWIIKVPCRVIRSLHTTIGSIRFVLQNCASVLVVPNLSGMGPCDGWWQKNLIVATADRGDVVVVLQINGNLKLTPEHLSEKDTYKLLCEVPTQEINRQFIEYLNTCK